MHTLLKYFYIHGPRWLGSWEGLSSNDICSSLTKVDANHWTLASDACKDLIDRKVHATFLGLSVVSAALMTLSCIQTANQALAY